MNDEDQEVSTTLQRDFSVSETRRVWGGCYSKSEKLAGDSQESTQFNDEEGLLYLKSNTADMTCNSGLLRAFDTTH